MAKRGRNEGSIYRQSDGRWVAAVSVGYRNGKRQRKRIYGATRGDVADELKRILSQQQDGLPIAVGRQTVAQYLTSWLRDSVKPSVRPSTYRSYHQLVELHLKPGLGRYPLSKLSPQHVQTFLNDQLADGRVGKPRQAQEPDQNSSEQTLKTTHKTPPDTLTPRTVQYLHAVLRRALNQATKWGLVPRNVAVLVTPPRMLHREIHPLTPDEARAFLSAIRSRRLYPLIAVSIACGLRQGEALGLQWNDVDLDRKTLHVRHGLQVVDKQRQLVELKTERSQRTLALPEQIVSVLRTHHKKQKEQRLAAGSRWQETGFVFTTRDGKPRDGCGTTRDFKRLLTIAGLPPFRWHDLRHSCASFLLAQGISARVVMEILGHSDIRLTLNTYSHVMPSLQQDAADQMDALLRGSKR